LPVWPFLGQISEIWPRFKLVGLKNFNWPFGFLGLIPSWLAFKNSFGRLAFYAEEVSLETKYYYSIFFGNTISKFL